MKVLVLTPFYKFFVKGLTDSIAKHEKIEEINVLVHHNYLSELAPLVPISYSKFVEKFRKNNLVSKSEYPEKVKVHVVSTLYFIPDGRNRGLGDKLFKIFDSYITKKPLEFDIIHAHFTWPQGYVAIKLGEKNRVPVVIHVHENQEWFMRLLLSKNKKIHSTWRRATALIRVNKKSIPLLKEFNVNTFYLPNGFNTTLQVSKNFARNKLKLSSDTKILFGLGHLIGRKGFQYLVESMNKIIRKRKDVICYIGGEGPLKKKLEDQIKKLNLQEHVKLLGFIPDEELYLWMNAADIFVLPSLSESFGVVQIEAMACGTPVVATINGGSEEIIISEDYGLLCKPGDAKDLAEKILIALEKEWDREKIRKYAEQFTWDNIAKQVVRVYEEVLK
ncbi:MAG: glycosyltransferase [Archaeoglobaceae archaeon]